MTAGVETQTDALKKQIKEFYLQTQHQLFSRFKEGRPRVLVLAGPTAVGKTNLAIKLAQMLGGEIISADSMQVYRGMDIGTAKATREEQAMVPHHLIDIRDVRDVYNVSDFFEDAHETVRSILARGRVPIIAGGTGFYIHAFLYGPPSGPPAVPEVREDLEREMRVLGTEKLFDRLMKADPAYASTITPKDKHKIIRALEVITVTGKPLSSFSWHEREHPLYYDYRCWFLHRPRGLLYQRIDLRCDDILQKGLIEEVERLREHGLQDNPSATMAIGYRQTLDFLDSDQTDQDYAQFVDRFKQASRRYAKRQFTWFRKEALFEWINVEENTLDDVAKVIAEDYLS